MNQKMNYHNYINFCLIFIALLLFGCKTKERVVTVEKVRNDTTVITKHQRDSVWLHDSIHVTERGDTIRIEKWHTKYVEKATHDTLYQATHDTIPQPYPVEKLVERELTWWQQTRLHLANIMLWLLGIGGVLFIVKKKFL